MTTIFPAVSLDYGPRGRVLIYDDAPALARAAAETFGTIAMAAVEDHGRAFVALSGGSTPKQMGELLTGPPYRAGVPWPSLEIFWGDERWVPESSPESNAGEAKRIFLDEVPVRPEQIHPWPTVGVTPEESARVYADTIRGVLAVPEGIPSFDLIFLGMGDDGHTASLFPGTAALHVDDRLAVPNVVPKLDATRLTLTPPVLNAGRDVVFLVAGAGKAATLRAVLEGPEEPERLPSQLVRPGPERLWWLLDRAAAAQLGTVAHG